LPFGWAKVTRDDVTVHDNWRSGQLDFDYGVIVLPEAVDPIGARTGQFAYAHYEDADLNGSTPILSGYPDDQIEGTQWFEQNQIQELTDRRVFYDIFTAGGQSGSPVFFRDSGDDIACAIHNWGDTSFNSGVRINPEVMDQLAALTID
jgi:V8-like Glu-specific endopeptidase